MFHKLRTIRHKLGSRPSPAQFFDGAARLCEIDTLSLGVLTQLFDYNYWARDRQLQACAGLTEEQFVRQLEGSFPSLRHTLTHLLAVASDIS